MANALTSTQAYNMFGSYRTLDSRSLCNGYQTIAVPADTTPPNNGWNNYNNQQNQALRSVTYSACNYAFGTRVTFSVAVPASSSVAMYSTVTSALTYKADFADPMVVSMQAVGLSPLLVPPCPPSCNNGYPSPPCVACLTGFQRY